MDFNDHVILRILFDAGVELNDFRGATFSLKDLFTYDKQYTLGKNLNLDARSVLFLLLIIQLWKEELASRGVQWCVYPSSKRGKISQNIFPYLKFLRGLTGSYFVQFLERVEDTVDKSLARVRGESEQISFDREKNTLNVSAESLRGKRVIVVDDFSTSGMSLEVAKHLLLEKEADQVVLCAIGKYTHTHKIYDEKGYVQGVVDLNKDENAQNKLIDLITTFNKIF